MTSSLDLPLLIAKALDDLRVTGTPVWTPLEAVMPPEWQSAWMFMEAREARILMGSPDRRIRKVIFSYKHGVTRRYLHIGDDLNAYVYRSDLCEVGDPAYTWTPMDEAIERAFEGIEELGADRTTPYDSTFIADRNRRLIEAGFTVVS